MMCYYGYRTDNGQGMRMLECVHVTEEEKKDAIINSRISNEQARQALDMVLIEKKTLTDVSKLFKVDTKTMKRVFLKNLNFDFSEHVKHHKPWAAGNARKMRERKKANRSSD